MTTIPHRLPQVPALAPVLALVLSAAPSMLAQKMAAGELIAMAAKHANSPAFRDALIATLGAEELQKGTAAAYEGPSFLFAIDSAKTPALFVNDEPAPVKRIKSSSVWFHTARLRSGMSHAFYWSVDGRRFGGRPDVPAYQPDCYEAPGVPKGTLSEKMVHESRIYPGLKCDWWTYVPAQYDGSTPMAVMVWQDGEGHVRRDGAARTMNVADNLIHRKKIPVMIQVFISPGMVGDRRWRSIQYDTVSDTYGRFLRDEILAEVAKKYRIRPDGYSRAIAGNSSGGICAFNAAWHMPEEFSRVLSRIGSFTSIQWKAGELDGGNVYPFKVRKEPKRNIRAWIQDGAEDLENAHGSWPLQNIQLANSLKYRGYDFHFSWGGGAHNAAHGNAELPAAMEWLWREYDPARTAQEFTMDPAEKDRPYFRVKTLNRD